jgi:hypothetical protein
MVKKYRVGWIGANSDDQIISTDTMKEAKKIFASKMGVQVSSYIVASSLR